MSNTELKTYSKEAWGIASHFSGVLASDTRTLAAMIDVALERQSRNPARPLVSIDAYEALTKHRRQIDTDGSEVGVSWEALNELLSAVTPERLDRAEKGGPS